MKIEQIYTGCLAHGAYYLESNGEAAIIDPLREVQPYIDMAESRGAKIKYIFETHFHADFVSGHIDLSKKTGAPIIYGPTNMETGFEMTVAEDGQEFQLGNATIRLIHTPGHTPESSCYLLIDESGKETSLFSGDTVFIGDVGRPDLAQKVIAELTQEKLASMLYDSIHNKILPMNDDIIVYPAHGAGSACGKNISKETSDTLGNQKKTNYALDASLSREDFIAKVLDGLTEPPGYFPHNVLMNIQGYDSIDSVVSKGTEALSPAAVELLMEESDAILLDTRDASSFSKAHIKGAYNIGLDGSFANWVGVVFKDVQQPLIIIAEKGREEEVAVRMARIGFDNNKGYLKGGINSWEQSGRNLEYTPSISVEELTRIENPSILDVRKESEYDSEHVINALNVPLDYWSQNLAKVDKDKTWYVHCQSGYRSMVFISILQGLGYTNLVDVQGGFVAINASNKFNISEYVCPSTML